MNPDDLFLFPRQWMDDEATSVSDLVKQWAEKEILSKRMDYRENYGTFFSEKRATLNLTIGLQRLVLPSEHGGFGWNTPAHAPGILTIASDIGRADTSIGVSSAIMYAVFATHTMGHNLNTKLCEALAPLFMADEIKTPTLILPGAGLVGKETPLFKGRSILAQATSVKGGYLISGENLRPIAAGATADLFCVVCAGKNGTPCIAFIPGDAPGIRRGTTFKTTGLNALENADITFTEVTIARENLMEGEPVVEELYTWLNLLLGGVSLGAGINAYEIFRDWSENRVIKGGTLLKENPLCASVLADVADEIATARLLLYDLAQMISSPGSWGDASALHLFTYAEMIGCRVQQGVLRAINRGMELMGSAGYAKEWHVEKHWRDVKTIGSLLSGVGAEGPVRMDTARFFYDCNEI
ncbi:MAG: acyl-CoA dehydrogenase family protein [Desulfomonilia bacterium]|nr:acyl-CoA dehydrogenase family protein [Desulfomonilia bacterium]